MFFLDKESIWQTISDIQKIREDSRKCLASEMFAFESFKAVNHPAKLGVIDGSNHNQRGANFTLTALRTGYQIYEKEKMIEEKIDPIVMELLANNKDHTVGFEHKFEKYYVDIVEELPEQYPEFEKTPDRIRTLMEWKKLKELIQVLAPGDMIVFDGALMSGTITTNKRFVDGLLQQAKDKNMILLGLSKDTSLSIESAPVPMVLLESAEKFHPDKNWFVPYKDNIYFVRFTKMVNYVYRCDLVLPEGVEAIDAFSRLAAYCFDFATPGYPFPMQAIHDAVRIDEMQKEECLYVIKQECIKQGVPAAMMEQLLQIYHDQLDQISFGR